MDIISYILSKRYCDNAIVGLGAIKGANCTVKDIVHQDGINTVTFEWEGTDGTKKTRDMVVYDGTPIYVWESGNTYHYGDLAIYESQFYRCIVENNDATFDSTKWNEIGSPDGNYDIVQSVNLLPARFTAADRKLYYVIDENCFYLWNGTAWVKTISNKIADLDDVNLDDLTEGDVLVWDSVNEKWVNKAKFDEYKTTFVGTQAEWDALTPAQQNVYEIINITNDGEVINLGVYLEKKAVLPTANADNVGTTYIYTGASNANYKKGACYECQHIGQTYTWVQVSVSKDDFNALGTASAKNYTSNVRPNNTDLVESQAVYSAINNALASIYVPRGDLSCAELTADLLIPANVGNVYTMSDSGTTSALFINGAGHPIATNDNVGIIKAGADSIMFNLMGNAFDLHDYQTKELETPLTINGTQETEVEGALGGLVEAVDNFRFVTPEQFGAIGDGVNDDTNALQSAVNSEKTIVFNPKGNYKITHRVILKSNTVYDFNEATVTCYNGAGFNVGNTENITIQNINLIGSEESGYNARIVCDPKESSADGFKLLNSNIINYYKDSRTNNHSQWAFLGSGSNMIFDNCHIDTHLGGCWGGCVHFAYGQNIRVTNCWVYGGDDAIAPLPHCGGMFGDLSSIDVGLSVYIDNCWLASWYAYCVGIGTFLGESETTHTEWLPPSDNVKVYVTNSKLHNHVFKDGTRNTIASHYVSCVNCEFTYDPTLREDLGYPYQSYESFYLIGANSVDDIDIDDAQFNFDNCTFDFSLTQVDSPLISQLVKPISHLSFTNSTFTNNGDCFVRLAGKVTKELLFDNVTFNLTQSHETIFIRETIAEHIIIRNSNIISNASRVLMLDANADNIQYIEITNNVINLLANNKCVLYDSPMISNANIIIKNNTTNGFIPSVGFIRDNNIYDIDAPLTLDVNTKPYLTHKADYMLVKPQGESWLLNNCNFLAKPLAQSISSLNAFKYFACTKLNQAVIPFDFSMFGDNVIENTPCKTVIKSIDNFGAVSIFEAASNSEYITVAEDFYLYLASGQCGSSYDWSTMTVYFDDDTTLDVWAQPTLIQAGKVIKKVRLNIKHNTLYQSNNIVYQFATKREDIHGAYSIINNTVSNVDIYNNIINYDATFAWKANDIRLLNVDSMSFSNLFLDLADDNVEVIVSPIFQAHSFEFDYYVDWNNSADNIVEFTAQELQAMW